MIFLNKKIKHIILICVGPDMSLLRDVYNCSNKQNANIINGLNLNKRLIIDHFNIFCYSIH